MDDSTLILEVDHHPVPAIVNMEDIFRAAPYLFGKSFARSLVAPWHLGSYQKAAKSLVYITRSIRSRVYLDA